MLPLPKEIQIKRSLFLRTIREFLETHAFLEVDTPSFKPVVGMEPYLDPFQVKSPNGKESGYLITSPEYSLKETLSTGFDRIYEIAHTFRSGEKGSSIHSAEFLMLELYVKGWAMADLIEFIKGFFVYLQEIFFKEPGLKLSADSMFIETTVEKLFLENTGKGYTRAELIETIIQKKLYEGGNVKLTALPFEDLFFLVFLNLIEPNLPKGILFCKDYPAECASLAIVKDGVAKRFEVYWDGIEIGNAFQELTDFSEQKLRFEREQEIRQLLGKEVFPLDWDFLHYLEAKLLPPSVGISLGLDRIFMKILGFSSLENASPYYQNQTFDR